MQIKLRFWVTVYATLCGDGACRARGMQVKLRCWVTVCNPLRGWCVARARNAGKVVFPGFRTQPAAEIIVHVEGVGCR